MNAPFEYLDEDYTSVKQLWEVPSRTPGTGFAIEQFFTSLNFSNLLNHFPCVNWILDVATHDYTYISNNTLEYFGYRSDNYTSNGYRFQDEIKHPDDRVNSHYLLGQVWRILSDISATSRANFRFSYDYRIVKPDGRIARILEQNSVLRQDEAGNITHLIGVCSDITEWKRSGTQVASLSSIIDKKCFFFNAENIASRKTETTLSRRELEILKLISEGHSSKWIADKLFISFHTVNTHRQKMIEKTKTKNASGLVQFAICNGLI